MLSTRRCSKTLGCLSTAAMQPHRIGSQNTYRPRVLRESRTNMQSSLIARTAPTQSDARRLIPQTFEVLTARTHTVQSSVRFRITNHAFVLLILPLEAEQLAGEYPMTCLWICSPALLAEEERIMALRARIPPEWREGVSEGT